MNDLAKQYVYIGKYGDLVKIGHSTKPHARMKAIISSSGRPMIDKWVSKPLKSSAVAEKALHAAFAQDRAHGEFFSSSFSDVVAAAKITCALHQETEESVKEKEAARIKKDKQMEATAKALFEHFEPEQFRVADASLAATLIVPEHVVQALQERISQLIDVYDLLSRRCDDLEARLAPAQVEETKARLDLIEDSGVHYTICGWGMLSDRQFDLHASAAMDDEATKYCKERGIQTGAVPDARFGRANTYPKNVLDYLFTGDEVSN